MRTNVKALLESFPKGKYVKGTDLMDLLVIKPTMDDLKADLQWLLDNKLVKVVRSEGVNKIARLYGEEPYKRDYINLTAKEVSNWLHIGRNIMIRELRTLGIINGVGLPSNKNSDLFPFTVKQYPGSVPTYTIYFTVQAMYQLRDLLSHVPKQKKKANKYKTEEIDLDLVEVIGSI